MCESRISSAHIQKLGHQIPEIRERGLVNIISKLERGVAFDNDLARTKELLEKLLDWFLWEPSSYEETVLKLIGHLVKSENGRLLIQHIGPQSTIEKLNRIKTYTSPSLHNEIDNIIYQLSLNTQTQLEIPPLEINTPRSCGTEQTEENTTPQTIETLYHKIPSSIQREGDCCSLSSRSSGPNLNNKFQTFSFPWQSLIESDSNVLKSVEHSLRSSREISTILQTCQFFKDILIRDFPAEIFLQRPFIINTLHNALLNWCSNTVKCSILNCFKDFISALKIRVNNYLDPHMYNCKNLVNSKNNSQNSSPNTANTNEEIVLDVPNQPQMSILQFCFKTINLLLKLLFFNKDSGRKISQNVYNLDLIVLEDLIDLLKLIIDKSVWLDANNNDELLEDIVAVLTVYGEALGHFRLETMSNDSDCNLRAIQITLIYNCVGFLINFIPLSKSTLILPECLKTALEETLVDSNLARLYPKIYEIILEYVESFNNGVESSALKKYKLTKSICEGLEAIDEFLKKSQNQLKLQESMELVEKALPAIEIYKHKEFIKKYIKECASKFSLQKPETLIRCSEEITLRLLSHRNKDIKLEMYKTCHRRVIEAVGPKLNFSGSGIPGSQILFLIRPRILIEISLFGVENKDEEIQKYAMDILIHIVKCKILVTEEIWNKILESLISSFPIVLCHSSKKSVLGKNLVDLLDPDSGPTFAIPTIEILKGNIILMFCKEIQVREEAFSRLCWLLASQEHSRDLLPRITNLHDKALYNIFKVERPPDINKSKSNQHFYQPSSLIQVLELLKSENIEPVIRRSALTQICVMTEDPVLHSTFLDHGGVELMLKHMEYSLNEDMFDYYPDCLIPIIGTLKNLCLFVCIVRRELSLNRDIYYWILRAAFLFFTENHLQQDACSLLFLLLFSDFILGSPSKGDTAIPLFLSQKLEVPFVCNYYWKSSEFSKEDTKELILSDPWCLRSIQIQINSNLLGGFHQLMENPEINYDKLEIEDYLKLSKYDLMLMRATSVSFCIRKYLYDIQNGTSHEMVMGFLSKLTTYVHLFIISQSIEEKINILNLPWEQTFSRFLKILPSGEEDTQLLINVLNFLKLLTIIYKSEDDYWLVSILKNPSNPILDLLDICKYEKDDFKNLYENLISLLILNLKQQKDRHFLSKSLDLNRSWRHIIKIIYENLKYYQNQPLYNLSKLDIMLSCLVYLTGSLGCCDDENLIRKLVSCISELLTTFYLSKGSKASISVMGLSIIRNTFLVLNNLLAEIQFMEIKHWEIYFLDMEIDWLKSFYAFWSNRDEIIRAAAVHLLAGLAHSPRLAVEIVNVLKADGIWNSAISLLTDREECSLVKENIALLLANLCKHTKNKQLHESLKPKTSFLNMLDFFQFFKSFAHLINSLNLRKRLSYGTIEEKKFATPSLIKSIILFLSNLCYIEFDDISSRLNENGLIKLIFKCLSIPKLDITNKRELLIYCDILEMNGTICNFLGQLARNNRIYLGIILNTKDCLNAMILLLDHQLYYSHLPELVHLRNQLWMDIFNLLAVLTSHEDISTDIIYDILTDNGGEKFLETLCEAIRNVNYKELQTAGLSSLTFLLRNGPPSMQKLIDTVKIEAVEMKSYRSDENCEENNLNKMNILQEIYFGKSEQVPKLKSGENFASIEICKILMYLYDLTNVQLVKELTKKKSLITSALMELLKVSLKAKQFANDCGFLIILIKQLKEYYIKFSLESAECLKRIYEKKKPCLLLIELNELIGLLMNFMYGDELIKNHAATSALSDYIHKLWVWFTTERSHLVDLLKLLITFTTHCNTACQSLLLTNPIPGTGPRKITSNYSLIHEIINLINKELEQISKIHDLIVLQLSFDLLKNCCKSIECRNVFMKNNLFQNIARLHPSITKKQKTWENAQLLWLDFMKVFTYYPEGQSVTKIKDVLDLVMTISVSTRTNNRFTALLVLRNFTFFQQNRPRLLASGEFLNILQCKLDNGTKDEILVIVSMIWSLIANNQKAKQILKTANIDTKLKQALKHFIIKDEQIDEKQLEQINYVLNIIKE